MILGFPRGPRSIKNRPKIVWKTFLSYDAKSTPKKVRKISQHSPKMEPRWDHFGIKNRFKRPAAPGPPRAAKRDPFTSLWRDPQTGSTEGWWW